MDFRILGPLQVCAGGSELVLGGGRQRAVLALLVLRANELVSSERLIEEVWEGRPPAHALPALHNYVAALRKLLEPEHAAGEPFGVLLTEPSGYLLRLEPDELDRERFERLAADGRAALASGRHAEAARLLREALALWRGAALADFAYAEFARTESARLEELRLATLEYRLEADLALGREGELTGELEALVAEYPLRERLRGQLMLALYRSGRQAEALAAYQEARGALVEELGIEPSPALQQLERAILNQDPALVPPAQSRAKTNLPEPPNPLVGRERELAAVCALLESEHVSLVTLTGAGGSGKSRLALEVGRSLLGRFPDGVFLVELAPLRDPELLVATIVRTLEVSERAGEPLAQTLADALGGRRALLVLDNFEQLLGAAPAVGALLAAASGLRVLVTSRAPLRVRSEHEFPVPPLAVPNGDGRRDVDSVLRSAAVRLFVERARAVNLDFELTDSNAPALAEVCIRLNGLPLAIELAGARSKVLSPDAMVRRLARPLELLTGGMRDLPARQRTLRATIDWSHALIGDDERRLFARLAVFAGGWTLETAEAVCGDGDVLSGLSSLVDNGLVAVHATGTRESRFTMLETIQEYALERLEESGETESQCRRHAEHFLSIAEAAHTALHGSDQVEWLDMLDAEYDNLRAALGWAIDDPESGERIELGLRLAASLVRFWYVRRHTLEGLTWLERVLAADRGEAPRARAGALYALGLLVDTRGDPARATSLLEESVALHRTSGDRSGLTSSLNSLGLVVRGQGDLARARELFTRSLELARELDDRFAISMEHCNLGLVARDEGSLDEARALFEQALALDGELGDRLGVAINLANLGAVAVRQNDLERAKRVLGDALRTFREVGHDAGAAECLEWIAVLAHQRAHPEQSARLTGAAAALRDRIGVPLTAAESAELDHELGHDHSSFNHEPLAGAYAAGEALTEAEAVQEALREIE